MEIGKPKRVHRVEPVQDPVPRKHVPATPAPSSPLKEPQPLAPAR
jgi:hypothetical protein